jgi:chromosome segregation protein
MRLQRLEIAGFKSFPDRSELTFDDGVTAIVGPNGCGKSNLVDALTWVLGEQSAKSLRGDRMEDVIFGGSDARKPTGAAEVKLKLAGVAARIPMSPPPRPTGPVGAPITPSGELLSGVVVDDDTPLVVRDVELMRRLYRSGESEYLIDGESCRLRDVQDLLMDAGLGVKGYAVIEQGKIGQILSAKPTERRQLIEEAAGVTKFKSRRRAAELKLEAAQQNLTRVDDIIFEVEKQRGTLKRQAAKARRYKRLREELRRWEKVQFAQRYRLLGEAIEGARTKLADARARETAAAAHLAEVETTLERLRLELTDADGRTTAAREAAHASELENGRLQQQIAFDKQQVESLGVLVGEIEAELQALDARREPARLEIEGRREAATRVAAERDQALDTLRTEETSQAELERRIQGLEGDVEAARSEQLAASNAATALRHAMEHAVTARERLAEQIAKLDAETNDLQIESAGPTTSAPLSKTRWRGRAPPSMVCASTARLAIQSCRRRGPSATPARRTCAPLNTTLAGVRARLTSLEELDAARAEYGDGARLVLAESGEDVGHMGSVADYLDTDSRYERAVEACLGDLLQHVVVGTHGQAAAGLRFARERNAGRVGFLVAEGVAADSGAPAPADGLTRSRTSFACQARRPRPSAAPWRRLGGRALRGGPYRRPTYGGPRSPRSMARSSAAPASSRAERARKRGVS